MGISISGMVNSSNTKQSMLLSGRGPDWSIIPSSGKSSKSKAEFTNEIKELARKAANTTSKAELEYIHRRRTESLAEKKFALAGGGTLTCPILTSGGYGADIYCQGTKVLTYLGSGYGWVCERTPAEREKEREFYGTYFNEYHSLKNGKGEELEALPDYLEEKPLFDRKA